MFQWFAKRTPDTNWSLLASEEGLIVGPVDLASLPKSLRRVGELDSQGARAVLYQLEGDGYASLKDGMYAMPWGSVYGALEHPAYEGLGKALRLPPPCSAAPILESRDGLSDESFSIYISGWHDGRGRPLGDLDIVGALAVREHGYELLPKASWVLASEVGRFLARSTEDRNERSTRQAWARLRQLALAANGQLDSFLYRSIVLSPERLEVGLRKAETGGTKVVEVAPSFEGAPEDWLATFDRYTTVRDRYDIPTADGIVQVLITPQVKTVLQQVKHMPGRRVAGTRAEAFLANPFAALGEAAAEVIDSEQFERARTDAGLTFEQFTAVVNRDALGYPTEIGLLIQGANKNGSPYGETHLFGSDDALAAFIRLVQSKLDTQLQFCGWKGYDFELLGDTPAQLEELGKALRQRSEPRVLISYATVHDLSHYSPRVKGIGVEKAYYSPYIAKRREDDGWFPENVVPVIAFTPEGESEHVAVPLTDVAMEQLRAKCEEAKRVGSKTFDLKGFPKPVPVAEAEFILSTFEDVSKAVRAGTFDPAKQGRPAANRRLSPVVKANIQSIDYEEARRDLLLAYPSQPALPSTLKADVALKDHQIKGVAWLQHLYGMAPAHCRGAVLADDMGLGKTLQLLTLLARAFEAQPTLDPALVVAPLSLLENWKEEVERFFEARALRVLTAYGDQLSRLRVPRASIDQQLQQEGLVKFLRPNWRGDANVVLTTYETLRDLEFSFATEKWSFMICDEAQRVKNPNAMVTRAAKKQNVRFKIACTGTPVENTLADLWCLFDFVQPGMLGALNDFGRRYRKPIEAESDEEKARVEELRTKISAQILRRTKADVAKDLPRKIVVDACRKLPLSAYQRSLYAGAIDLFKRRRDPTASVPFKNHLGLLHYLRLICTDPRRHGLDVFKPEPIAEYRAKAPKLDWLLNALRQVKERGEKAIVFCEFRSIQAMLRHYIEEALGYAPDIINGDTSASASHAASRHKRIKAFQERPGFGTLILSPLAVGFGVNIQQANHVIHYTRTWNPAKEDQATDRAYRIGQTNDVYVYYPVVAAEDFTTFDVKLDQLLDYKRGLATDILNGSGDILPGEFDIAGAVPKEQASELDSRVTLDDALRMRPEYFESLVAALWQKRGFKRVYRTSQSNDDGVDVVAIVEGRGQLIQCKSSMREETQLGWEAIKDVVTGEAAYRQRFPNVVFEKVGVTNQYFNDKAQTHATLNNVSLVDQRHLAALLEEHVVTMLEVERFVYSEWGQTDA
jgi:HJR/Mrr/RecB family endonuclease